MHDLALFITGAVAGGYTAVFFASAVSGRTLLHVTGLVIFVWIASGMSTVALLAAFPLASEYFDLNTFAGPFAAIAAVFAAGLAYLGVHQSLRSAKDTRRLERCEARLQHSRDVERTLEALHKFTSDIVSLTQMGLVRSLEAKLDEIPEIPDVSLLAVSEIRELLAVRVELYEIILAAKAANYSYFAVRDSITSESLNVRARAVWGRVDRLMEASYAAKRDLIEEIAQLRLRTEARS